MFSRGATVRCPLEEDLNDNSTLYVEPLLTSGEVMGSVINGAIYCLTFKLVLTRVADNQIIQVVYASSNVPDFPNPL